MNVAVTGVGGGVGQSIIKALQNTAYNSIGIDAEILATGLYATKKSYLGLYAENPKCIDRLIEICNKEDCKVIFPGLDIELKPFSNNIGKFEENNIKPIVSRPEVVNICTDKLLTANFLKNNNFPYPKTYPLSDYSFELEFPVKLNHKKAATVRLAVLQPRIGKSLTNLYLASMSTIMLCKNSCKGTQYLWLSFA